MDSNSEQQISTRAQERVSLPHDEVILSTIKGIASMIGGLFLLVLSLAGLRVMDEAPMALIILLHVFTIGLVIIIPSWMLVRSLILISEKVNLRGSRSKLAIVLTVILGVMLLLQLGGMVVYSYSTNQVQF